MESQGLCKHNSGHKTLSYQSVNVLRLLLQPGYFWLRLLCYNTVNSNSNSLNLHCTWFVNGKTST